MFAYESLDIWKLAIEYARTVYKVTDKFPKSEIYGLTNQLRRAAVSVSANIAEGSGASSLNDKLHYLDIAIKSALETTSETQIAFELNYLDETIRNQLYEEAEKIIRKIRSYKKFLKSDK
ncbi:MAG: four helix bundle protein [Candidatus Daviesbacteria bacterium]|nr:four helix bundle protein [Candidatus Daviesbacteria bacterium]